MEINLKKNRTLLITFVVVMVIGLVAAYIPLLFSPPPLVQEPEAIMNPDQLLVPVEPLPTPALTPTSPAPQTSVPETQGFSGLSEEGELLQDLDSLLGN